MKFWDSSAIVPLLLEQRHSPRVAQLFQSDPELLVWWGTGVECVSAIARLEREGNLATVGMTAALDRLKQFAKIWDEVQPTPRLRGNAERLLRVHELRPADALQLAAMVEVGAEEPSSFEIVCLDERLSRAALREGFRVIAGS